MALFIGFLETPRVHGQTPLAIPYQAVARNAAGVPLANQLIRIRFSIRDSLISGPIVYRETHSATTNAFGLFNLNVGTGTVVSNTFSGVNWGKNAKFMQVEMDPTGGTNYVDLGTQQMMSVPYSRFAEEAGSVNFKTSFTGDTLYTGKGNFLIVPGISAANNLSVVISDIDGNTYQTFKIGSKVWMKENLKVSRYQNGDPIPTNLTDSEWETTTSGAYVVYNNLQSNNDTYGKLYNWHAVADSRGVCPAGWHVPTDEEWTSSFGNSALVGGKMKAVSSLWNPPNTGATNETNFTGLPGGFRYPYLINDIFDDGIGSNGWWWSSTLEENVNSAWFRILYYDNEFVYRDNSNLQFGLSIRCVKN